MEYHVLVFYVPKEHGNDVLFEGNYNKDTGKVECSISTTYLVPIVVRISGNSERSIHNQEQAKREAEYIVKQSKSAVIDRNMTSIVDTIYVVKEGPWDQGIHIGL